MEALLWIGGLVVLVVVLYLVLKPLLTWAMRPPTLSKPVVANGNQVVVRLNKRDARWGLFLMPLLAVVGGGILIGALTGLGPPSADGGRSVVGTIFFAAFGLALLVAGVHYFRRCVIAVRDGQVKLAIRPTELVDYQSGGPVTYCWEEVALVALKLNPGVGEVDGGPRQSAVVELLLRPDGRAQHIPVGHLDIDPALLAHIIQTYLNASRNGATVTSMIVE